jgi:hypothetical protein
MRKHHQGTFPSHKKPHEIITNSFLIMLRALEVSTPLCDLIRGLYDWRGGVGALTSLDETSRRYRHGIWRTSWHFQSSTRETVNGGICPGERTERCFTITPNSNDCHVPHFMNPEAFRLPLPFIIVPSLRSSSWLAY